MNILIGLILLAILTFPAFAKGREINPELLRMELEELLNLEVTSAAKHPQKLSEVAAAVFVISEESLRHSFTDFIPELLRDVPGVHVARTTASDWAISIRGFNDRFANKLLVLMDGRSLYTPLFSGVHWERQDAIIEDLDRIEVIRGPGGSLWGANAVNGIINIITKSAWDTQGFFANLKVGNEESLAALRYGGHGENVAYRVYLKAREVDSSAEIHNGQAHDDWRMLQGGFRFDWKLSPERNLRFSGDAYTQTAGVVQSYYIPIPPYEIFFADDGYGFGANFLLKLEEKKASGHSWCLQAYYDTSSATGYPLLNWDLDVYDIEFQQVIPKKNLIWTWGLGYRLYDTYVKKSVYANFSPYAFVPAKTKSYILNAFGQAEIDLTSSLKLILGSKFEYHEETGLNFQPTGRFLWKVHENKTIWGAISRAVRTPSRGELDAVINIYIPRLEGSPYPLFLELHGNDDLDPETLLALELGYRQSLNARFQYDVTVFFNVYDDLITVPLPEKPPVFHPKPWPHLHTYAKAQNSMDGETYGFELSAFYRPTSPLFFQLSYSYLKMFLHAPQKTIWFGEDQEDVWPRHIFSLRSCYEIGKKLHLDARVRYVSKVPLYDIPSYWATDIKLSWKANENLSLSFIGQNIFDPRHPEFGQYYALRTPLREVERSFFLKITWQK